LKRLYHVPMHLFVRVVLGAQWLMILKLAAAIYQDRAARTLEMLAILVILLFLGWIVLGKTIGRVRRVYASETHLEVRSLFGRRRIRFEEIESMQRPFWDVYFRNLTHLLELTVRGDSPVLFFPDFRAEEFIRQHRYAALHPARPEH
jgi:hypothetical protein